jgi:hypothetical protein
MKSIPSSIPVLLFTFTLAQTIFKIGSARTMESSHELHSH